MRSYNYGRLQQQASFLRRQFLQDGDLPFTDVLSEGIVAQALTAAGVIWLDRIYSPLVTLWVFLGQVLSADHWDQLSAIRVHDRSAEMPTFGRAEEDVSEAVLSFGISSDPVRTANYAGDRLASSGLAGTEHSSTGRTHSLRRRVITDRAIEQSPTALETNDADDARINRDEVPPLRQPSTTHARRVCHDAPQVIAM
jgi:hypothetical protein